MFGTLGKSTTLILVELSPSISWLLQNCCETRLVSQTVRQSVRGWERLLETVQRAVLNMLIDLL